MKSRRQEEMEEAQEEIIGIAEPAKSTAEIQSNTGSDNEREDASRS